MARRPRNEDLDDALEMAAADAIGLLWSRMLNEALGQYATLQRQRLPPAEIARRVEGFLETLSQKPEELKAREAANVAYNEGRNLALKQARREGLATFKIRSVITEMDSNICATCFSLDGTVTEIGSADGEATKPPAGCEGGERCRCTEYALGGKLVEA